MAKPLINNLKDLVDLIYPVGSIYMSVSATSPQTLFGGTWSQLKDRFLLGVGDTYKNGTTGGEEKHTLTTSEMPKHKHTIFGRVDRNMGSGGIFREPTEEGNGTVNNTETGYSGSGQAHNNMPPYLSVYMWKRTG